jgi:predicted ATPase
MDIRARGRFLSIEDWEWHNIPHFAVITGLNGAGKSQLLEMLGRATEANKLGHSRIDPLPEGISVEFIGETYSRGEVLHSTSEWPVFVAGPSSEDDVRRAIHTLQASRLSQSLRRGFAKDLQSSDTEIRQLTPTQFARRITPNLLWKYAQESSPSLSRLFLSYRYFERESRTEHESTESFRKRVGDPPWILLRAVLEAAGLPFSINEPNELPLLSQITSNQTFQFELRDSQRRLVPLDRLSSGERVLMSTANWRYSAEIAGRAFKLLLLDEPDAHLHPALVRKFLNIIEKVFVGTLGVRVLMTTHSPSTVALADPSSIFVMRKGLHRLIQANRSSVIANLTDGFVAIQDATRTVMVEGRGDPEFYEIVWSMLTEIPHLNEDALLDKYPNLDFVHGQGRQTVQDLVPQMRLAGFNNVVGLIDRDKGNQAPTGVFVLGRRAIENYLFDPVVVWFALRERGTAPHIPNLTCAKVTSCKELAPQEIQSIVDYMALRVLDNLSVRREQDWDVEDVEMCNGVIIRYPKWFLHSQKAELRTVYGASFVQLSSREIYQAFRKAWVIPLELRDLLAGIQSLESLAIPSA